jgi:uncharacterized cupredoxin-like copper-binding protein
MNQIRGASALLVASLAVGVAAAAGPRARDITIVLREYSFTPATITLRAGVPVKLILANQGTRDHEFQLYSVPTDSPRDWNRYAMTHSFFQNMGEIDVALPGQAEIGVTSLFKVHIAPGASVTIWFTPQARGVFAMASHDPGRAEKGLKGTVVVR